MKSIAVLLPAILLAGCRHQDRRAAARGVITREGKRRDVYRGPDGRRYWIDDRGCRPQGRSPLTNSFQSVGSTRRPDWPGTGLKKRPPERIERALFLHLHGYQRPSAAR